MLASRRRSSRPLLWAFPVVGRRACAWRMWAPRSTIPLAERVLCFRIATVTAGRDPLTPNPRIEGVIAPFDFGLFTHGPIPPQSPPIHLEFSHDIAIDPAGDAPLMAGAVELANTAG